MALDYIEVTTVTCDICHEAADLVRHSDYDPQEIESQEFAESLEEKGWLLGEGDEKDLCPKCKEVKKDE